MVAAVIVYFLFRFANKDGKLKTEYDERQKAVRGKAYRYAFYAEIFAQVLIMWLFMSGVKLPVEDYALIFTGIILGCLVLACYSIWNDVYWGLNNDRRKYHIIFILAMALNALPVIGSAAGGSLFVNGRIGLPLLNIIVLVMMMVIYVEMIIKKILDKRADSKE